MRSDRLTLAVEYGAIALPPEGDIIAYRPTGADQVAALPKDRLCLVQGFRPDHDALAARGYRVLPRAEGQFAAAVVFLPRAKAQARALLADAAARVVPGGPVIVDGQKTDGIDAVLKDLRARTTLSAPFAKAHGKVFRFPAGPGLEDWAARPTTVAGGHVTRPGVFSADGPDRGSVLLAAALPDDLKGHVVDLGAGWGFLAAAVLRSPKVKVLDLVEAEAEALDCARENVTDPRARFHWADAATFRPERLVDAVVCNPPFHATRQADPSLGAAFLRAAAAMLAPDGTLWLVANRQLPYEPVLAGLFRTVEPLDGDTVFKLYRCRMPVRARR